MIRIPVFLVLSVVAASAQLARPYTKVFTQPTNNIIKVPAHQIIRVTGLGGIGGWYASGYTVTRQPVGVANVFAGPCELNFDYGVVSYQLLASNAKTLWFTNGAQTINVPAGRSLHVLDGMFLEEVSVQAGGDLSFLLQEDFLNPKTEWVGPLTITVSCAPAQVGFESGYITYEIRPVAPRRVQ